MKITLLLLILLVSKVGYCQPQEEFTTTITYIEGDVEVFKKGKWMKATLGMKLSSGDKIRTALRSKAELTSAEDSSIIKLQENTIFEIKRLVKDKNRGTVLSKFKLLIGDIWTRVKRITIFGSEFEITTPTAVLGIRGTAFWASVDDEGITWCGVEEGWVYFRGIHQKIEEEIILREGKSAKSSADGRSVSEPKEIPDELLKERRKKFSTEVKILYQLSTFEPYVANIPEITFIFIPVDKKILFPIIVNVDGVKYEVSSLSWVYTPPYLNIGINHILVEVKTQEEFPTIFNISTPYYDPFPPVIQSIVEEITPDYRLRLNISVIDQHSGVKVVRAEGRTFSKRTEDEYEWVSTKPYWKIDKVRIEVEDKAGNKIEEVFHPISGNLPPPPPLVRRKD